MRGRRRLWRRIRGVGHIASLLLAAIVGGLVVRWSSPRPTTSFVPFALTRTDAGTWAVGDQDLTVWRPIDPHSDDALGERFVKARAKVLPGIEFEGPLEALVAFVEAESGIATVANYGALGLEGVDRTTEFQLETTGSITLGTLMDRAIDEVSGGLAELMWVEAADGWLLTTADQGRGMTTETRVYSLHDLLRDLSRLSERTDLWFGVYGRHGAAANEATASERATAAVAQVIEEAVAPGGWHVRHPPVIIVGGMLAIEAPVDDHAKIEQVLAVLRVAVAERLGELDAMPASPPASGQGVNAPALLRAATRPDVDD